MNDHRTSGPPSDEASTNVIPLRRHWAETEQLVPLGHSASITAERDDSPLVPADGIWDDSGLRHEVCDTAGGSTEVAPERAAKLPTADQRAKTRRRAVLSLAVLFAVSAVLLVFNDGERPGADRLPAARTSISTTASRPAVQRTPSMPAHRGRARHAPRARHHAARRSARRHASRAPRSLKRAPISPSPTTPTAHVAVAEAPSPPPTATYQPPPPVTAQQTPAMPQAPKAAHSAPVHPPPEFGP